MKILILVSGQKWLGGLTIQTALLCRELERIGHEVAVVSVGADAVIDQFPHARIRHGANGRAHLNGHSSQHGQPGVLPVPGRSLGNAGESKRPGGPNQAAGGAFVFRYEVIADAARYLPPGPPAMRNALSPVARLGMAAVTPPQLTGRAPLTKVRRTAAAFLRGVTAALDAGLSGGAAEAPFLARLLLNTDQQDVDRLEEIRRWFQPDVEYACDLALVPLLARLEDRGIPLVAAAQGFELVHRRGVGLLEALERYRHRLDLILSGSQANIDENLPDIHRVLQGVPARAIPYGVALDGGWDMSRETALQRLRTIEPQLSPAQRGPHGLWGAPGENGAPFIITCLSRIDVEKGADLALHALAILRARGIPARLWIAGNVMPGSAYLDVLRAKIRMMDLDPHVNVIGTIGEQLDKVALLRASDAFVAGFIRSEPFGLVYTEAFASMLPVVAPANGAAPELMTQVGDTSTLYEPNNTGAMATVLAALYEDEAHRRRLARQQVEAFRQCYNATEMARAAAHEFEALARERAGQLHGQLAPLPLPVAAG